MAVVEAEAPDAGEIVAGGRPPHGTDGLRTTYLLLLAGLLVLVLWAFSTPLPSVFLGLVTMVALVAWGVIWAIGAVVTVVRLARRRRVRRWRWLVVASVLVTVTAVLVATDVPLHARWGMSRGAFEDAAAQADPDLPRSRTRDLGVDGRLGLYDVWSVEQTGEAVVFAVDGGGLFQESGFAHLPEGPFPELERAFESMTFTHLGGDWYVWSAVW